MGNVDCPIGLDAHIIRLNACVPHCLNNPRDLSLRERQCPGQRPFVAEWTKESLPNGIHEHNNAPWLAKILRPIVNIP
jgi:hypothetical protein